MSNTIDDTSLLDRMKTSARIRSKAGQSGNDGFVYDDDEYRLLLYLPLVDAFALLRWFLINCSLVFRSAGPIERISTF